MPLAEAGLDRVNMSSDSLRSERISALARRSLREIVAGTFRRRANEIR